MSTSQRQPPNRAIFLDRDGVINRAIVRAGKPYPPRSLGELEILPEAKRALPMLKEQGFRLLVVTNQPDVARGQQGREVVEAINERLMAELPLDQIYACYHDDDDGCACRKPLPGLILAGARDWHIELKKSFVVGDRWKDVEAGQRAGCTTFLLQMDYAEDRLATADYEVRDLLEVARIVANSAP